eukprot:g6090.t1
MDTDRSDEGQFSTPRAGARQAGYSSASDNEGDGGQGYSSARSWTSDNEYGTPRNSGNLVSSDSEVDGFYSGREQDTGYGSQRDRGNRTVHMPFVAGGNVPYSGGSSYGYKSSDNGGYSSGGGAYHQQPSGRPPPQGQYNLHGRPIQNHGGRPPPQHHQQQQYDYGPRDGGYSHQSQSQQQIHNNLGYNGHEYSAHQHQQSTYYNEDGSNNNYGAKVSEGQYMNNGHHHQSYHKPPPMHASPGRTTTKKESTIGKLGNTYGGASDEDIQAVLSAARHGRVQEVGAYLDQGVPVNIRDKFGNTILAIACQNGLKKMAKLALRRGADINSRNYKGNTPLHFCFTYGYGDTLGKYLISKGADPAIKNHQGTTCYEGLGGGDNKKK